MKTRPWIKRFFAVFIFIFFVCFAGHVSLYPRYKPFYTYYNFSFGARALSMSHAFTAVADDLSAVFWNPAGIARFAQPEVYLSYRTDEIFYDYDMQEFQTSLSTDRYTKYMDSKLKNIDFLSVSVPAYFWDMKWTFALSYYRYIPYGMEGKSVENFESTDLLFVYKDTVTFSGDGGIDVLAFSAAYYLSDYFHLGVTVQQFINSGTSQFQGVYSDAFTDAQADETYTEKLDGRNLILGFIFKPLRDVVIGMTYRTRLSNKFHSEYTSTYSTDGTSSVLEDSVQADVVLPARLSFGLLVQPFRFMRVSMDYSIIYWSLGRISNDFYQAADEEREFPTRSYYSFHQQDAVNYRLGVEFIIPAEKMTIFLRGGLFTEQPLFVDHNSNVLKISGYSLGVGLNVSSLLALDVAYMKQKDSWTEDGYLLDPTSPVFTHYKSNIVRLALTFRFGRSKDD
jgi:long-subunit fatty acid transport protein